MILKYFNFIGLNWIFRMFKKKCLSYSIKWFLYGSSFHINITIFKLIKTSDTLAFCSAPHSLTFDLTLFIDVLYITTLWLGEQLF